MIESASTCVSMDDSVIEGACEVRMRQDVFLRRGKVCTRPCQEHDTVNGSIACHFCRRSWHPVCMPARMRTEAQDSAAKGTRRQCWVCASVFSFVCGESVGMKVKKDRPVFCVVCMKSKKGTSGEWPVCDKDECMLSVHKKCAKSLNGQWVCGLC